LISECHRRKIHVLLDIVLQRVYEGAANYQLANFAVQSNGGSILHFDS
jgi:hypothetical protein